MARDTGRFFRAEYEDVAERDRLMAKWMAATGWIRGYDAEKTAQEALLLVTTRRSDEAPTPEVGRCCSLMGQGGGCLLPERLCDADGNAVLFVLDGTRWGELGTGWLGCKPQSADQIDRMLQNRRHHPFPPSGALRSGACLGLYSR
jgi:hypothetical protein